MPSKFILLLLSSTAAIALTSPTRNADIVMSRATAGAGAGCEQRMSMATLLPRVTPPPRAPSTNHIRPIDPIGDLLDAAVEDDTDHHSKKINHLLLYRQVGICC